MAEPLLKYRLWQRGREWHWQVMDDLKRVLASGAAESSFAARSAAFSFCLDHDSNESES